VRWGFGARWESSGTYHVATSTAIIRVREEVGTVAS
jgi:hypothetical protein